MSSLLDSIINNNHVFKNLKLIKKIESLISARNKKNKKIKS